MAMGNSAPATLLKSPREIEIMARGGAILHAALMHTKAHVRPGISTMELDQLVESFIRSHAGAEPAFKGLYGFPGSACISINEEVVHGIPSRKRTLKDGDIVTVDVGVKLEGMFTDAAITIPVGTIDELTQRLLDVTERSLAAGIAAAVPDNHVGDIGAAVQAVVEAEGFSVVRELVGHGVGFSPHEELQIPNYGKPKRGKKLSVGLTIAIEPMVNIGTAKTKTLSDKWTVVTADGKRSAHFEHTVAITDDGPRIITLPA
ncbi:type I methionyl aminopeptidase [Gemmatimonas sp.]|jgi:methionyl aminopeptidase|uniref:type I methionyl aminopeptidase n=1 Tax=Gemmatimonas sp. TaxID=1962908 RepID=UPI0037BEBE6C